MRELKARVNNVVSRTFDLLDILSENPANGLNVNEICSELDITQATAYSLLRTCLDREVIDRDPVSGRFTLGHKVYYYGGRYQIKYPFIWVGIKHTKETSVKLDVRSMIFVREGRNTVQIASSSSMDDRHLEWELDMPLWASAPGRILLAGLNSDQRRSALDSERRPLTDNTITDEKTLLETISEAGAKGYCVEHGEIDPESTYMAAPIHDASGSVVGAFCFKISNQRWDEEGAELLKQLRATARDISHELGYKRLPG
ncbi:MAG: IclR family transcriptional regulator [Firmicutes bacterium]|nr:IclR family transcriptional regulator [Bacillota bacterium]